MIYLLEVSPLFSLPERRRIIIMDRKKSTTTVNKPVIKESILKDQSWEDVLKEFILVKKAEGRAWRTLDDYESRVTRFFSKYPEAWTDETKHRDCLLEHLTRKYHGCDIGATAYNLDINSIKIFLGFCVEQGIFNDNAAAKFKKRRTTSRIVNIPTDILKRLIDLPDQKSYAGYRDHCLILLTLDCGIRPNEALTLLPKDINIKGREIHIRAENAKTRVARTLPISEHTSKALYKLIESRPDNWDDMISPVFCSWSGKMMFTSSWRWKLVQYGRRLDHKISPYDLRHSFALNFLRNGGNIFALQRIMGHNDLSMTRRYIALTEGDIQGQHDIASPVNSFMKKDKRVTKVM
jgi:site-specific recombinase XerD